MAGRVCLLNMLILFLALLGTLSVTQTTWQALAPSACVCVSGGPPSPALPGVRGGTKPLGTSSFCQFLMIYSALIRSFAGSSSNQNSVGAGGINLTEGQDPEAPLP